MILIDDSDESDDFSKWFIAVNTDIVVKVVTFRKSLEVSIESIVHGDSPFWNHRNESVKSTIHLLGTSSDLDMVDFLQRFAGGIRNYVSFIWVRCRCLRHSFSFCYWYQWYIYIIIIIIIIINNNNNNNNNNNCSKSLGSVCQWLRIVLQTDENGLLIGCKHNSYTILTTLHDSHGGFLRCWQP